MSDDFSTATLITCSYRGDLEVCRILCESIDRFAPANIGHQLFVPAQDMALFADLASPRRTIATQESLLPRWLWKIPLPGPEWRARLHLPRRNIYVSPFSPPVRGWIAQQIMKFAATAAAPTEIVTHVDSDNAFVRPLTLDHFVRSGRVRLYRNPEKVELNTHRVWHATAGRLLGLPVSDFYGAEYIDPLVVWRRSVLRGVLNRIEKVAGRDWRQVLAGTPHFAEYVLYGVFADRVLGLDAAGLLADPRSLCHSLWTEPLANESEVAAFVAAIQPHQVLCLAQSTIAMSISERKRVFARVSEVAAAQDQGCLVL
jgi:hypothetical protein